MLKTLTTRQNLMRLLYGGLGLSIAGQAIANKQWFLQALGAYFLLAAVFGWGCAGSQCAVPQNETKQEKQS